MPKCLTFRKLLTAVLVLAVLALGVGTGPAKAQVGEVMPSHEGMIQVDEIVGTCRTNPGKPVLFQYWNENADSRSNYFADVYEAYLVTEQGHADHPFMVLISQEPSDPHTLWTVYISRAQDGIADEVLLDQAEINLCPVLDSLK